MSSTLQSPNPEVDSRFTQPKKPERRSGLERFLDNFFREENIKWMSVIGAAIVLGSSLMLVTHEWKSWPAEVKYLAILGYTIGAYVCARLARFRFGLHTTAHVLHLLTLLLIPLCFVALSWLQTGESHLLLAVETIGLMVPAVVFMRYAALRIFDDLLRGRQATFAYSYMLLSMASALPPVDNVALASALSVAWWLVMSVGVMKVNRHIFWMIEEHKQPRVFAFFPIALLGAQFLVLVATKAVAVIPYEWLGMGCVMVSTTVLLTARTVAEVFKQRTGDLVRPLPWNLVTPLIIGLGLLASGVVLSFYGFSYSGPTTIAVVPTALVAGMLLCIVAWDTGRSGFVWAALVLLTLAYQTSPTLVAGLVQQLKQHAASAVNEASLPLAFYGITYLPLIVAMMIASRCCDLRGRYSNERLKLFCVPLRRFATMLTIGLFVLAVFNFKSLAIVSFLDVPLLLSMAVIFKDRRYAYGSLGCLVLASTLVVPLINILGWADISSWHILTAVAGLALTLVALPGIDRGLLRIPLPTLDSHTNVSKHSLRPPLAVCMIVGYGLALGVSVCWTVATLAAWQELRVGEVIQFVLLLSALLLTTIRTRDYLSAVSFWMLGGIGAIVALMRMDLPWDILVSGWSIAAASISLAGYVVIQRMRRSSGVSGFNIRRSSDTNFLVRSNVTSIRPYSGQEQFSGPAHLAATLVVSLSDLSLAIAVCLAAFFHIPALAIANLSIVPLTIPIATSIMMVWGISLAHLFRSRMAGAIIAGLIPLWGFGLLVTYSGSGLSFSTQTLVWILLAGCLSLLAWVRASRSWQAVCITSQSWVAVLTVLSLFNADPMFRVVGMLGLAVGYVLYSKRWTDRIPATIVAILTSLHAFVLVIGLYGIEGWFHQWMLSAHLTAAVITLLPIVGLSTLIFDTRSLPLDRNFCKVWSACLRNLALGIIILAFGLGDAMVHLTPLIVLGCVIIAVTEFVQAVRHQSEVYAWLGLCAVSAAGLWLARVGFIELGIGISQVVLVISAAIGLLLAHMLWGHARYGVFARPMLYIGLTCPALLTGMAIMHELGESAVAIDPLNTLTMFGAAAVYFHQGLVRKQRRYVLLAVAIINVALALTWRGLHIYDAQVYCIPIGLSIIGIVQLLQRELPKSAHDPLRYAGALVMLVSPLFAVFGGSWLHLFTLLALCVCVILLAIGLRLRALIHTGTAFLLADLAMMVVRSSIDHPSLLWVCGLGLGGAVIILAAICERHREQVLSRIRLLTAELATWN